jgi:small subunit ribosomal protein S16
VGETAAVAVKIRLKRLGKIREPYYRVVVADSRTKRDGRAIEEIGKYHPKLEPSLIDIDSDRVQYWLSVGAQPTDQVRHLLTITGDWQKFKGLPGAEGTLKTGESKADKKERYEELVKESLAVKEAKAAAKPARSAARKAEPKKAEPEKAEPKKAEPEKAEPEAPAAEAPAAEATEAPAAEATEAPAAESAAAESAEA